MNNRDTFELLIMIIGGMFIVIGTFIYYANPKFSACNRCGKDISIKKKDRYWAKVNGENVAICKSCYNKPLAYGFLHETINKGISPSPSPSPIVKPFYEPSKYCYGCVTEITRRMKAHKIMHLGNEQIYCSKCNRYISSKIKNDAEMSELLSNEFLDKNSDVKNVQELVSLYGKPIDLKSSEWDNHILRHTKFNDWESLKTKALDEINREAIVKALQHLRKKNRS
ncbi:hypothetical protein ACWI58_003234 [Vibrio fluvialis]